MDDSTNPARLTEPDVLIMGAGPAGLTVARQLHKAGLKPLVLEKDDIVGGISRSISYKGYYFDIGGHRFFTKVQVVEDMWHDILKEDFLLRSRTSRIYYNGKFFHYPLRPLNALFGLGIVDSVRVFLSYVYAHVFPIKDESTFEDWVTNRFGSRLYNIFFKTYTEKVWGMPCSEISAEWAAQRIKGLSLITALVQALVGARPGPKKDVIKTLVEAFHYPKRGPGMMWEKVTEELREGGHEVLLNTNVTKIYWSPGSVTAIEVSDGQTVNRLNAPHAISSIPIGELVRKMDPAPPAEIVEAANALNYRDFVIVALVIDVPDIFSDNWIYIHDDSVKVGRIQNFKNWSPDMVPDQSKTCLGLEFFCFEGDGLWTMPDEELVELAKDELQSIGLVDRSKVEDGTVARVPKAYPVYDKDYAEQLGIVRQFLATLENLQLVGRNGMHKYNNQDHSMLTAILAVENILGADHDLWAVNVEEEYHEELTPDDARRAEEYAALEATQPKVPSRVVASSAHDEIITKSFARLDKAATAIALGLVCSAILFLATLRIWFLDDPVVSAKMELLNQYFFGYSLTPKGLLLGCAHAFAWGAIFGWLLAYIRNLALGLYVGRVARRVRSDYLKNMLDYI